MTLEREVEELRNRLAEAEAALLNIAEYAETSYAEAAIRERVGDTRLKEVSNRARRALLAPERQP